jgi:hypothetical protein
MFGASWSKEGGTTSVWALFVVTLLALTWARGAAAWRTRFRLRADFERSGWWSSIISTLEVHSCIKGLPRTPGDERMKDHHGQVLDRLVAAKGVK